MVDVDVRQPRGNFVRQMVFGEEFLKGRRVWFVTAVSAATVVWIIWRFGDSPWPAAMRTASEAS